MTTLHLFRHGETEWHGENRYAGSSDVALTELGREQARRLAAWAATQAIAAVATSDLSRAVETGRAAANAAGLTLTVDPRLREVDFGRGEGRTRAEMAVEFPRELAEFLERPASTPLPDAEPGTHAADRGLAAIADLVASHDDGARIVIVAHSTLIRLVLCRMLGLDVDDYRRRFPELGNVAETCIRVPAVRDADDLRSTGQLLRYNSPA